MLPLRLIASGMEEVEGLHRYTCAEGFYNPAATLFFTSGEKTIEHLFSRNTHYQVRHRQPVQYRRRKIIRNGRRR